MNKKVSVLRVVFGFYPFVGGSITHITELSEKIDAHLNKQVIIAPLFDEKACNKEFPFNICWVKWRKIFNLITFNPFKLFIYSFLAIRKVSQLTQKDHFDFIHVHGLLEGLYINILKKLFNIQLPLVIMVHGWYPRKAVSFGVSYHLGKILLSLFPPDYLILLDDGTKINELENILVKNSTPYKVVYHAIDTDFYKPETNKVDDCFKVLFPHRPIKVKKPDVALLIFKNFVESIFFDITKTNGNIQLIFLAAKDSNDLIEKVHNYNLCSLVDFVDKQDKNGIKKYFNYCDVVIGTSLESNMGRSIQEAMACEKPIIAFNTYRISDLIENMVDGILIEQGNMNDFVRSLVMLYQNPKIRIDLGKNARNKILLKRTWEARITDELSVYKYLIESRNV